MATTTRLPARKGRTLWLLAAQALVCACASTAPPRRSTLQEKIGTADVSATELRLRLYELPAQLGSLIETAADQIRAESTDRGVRRRALLWQADGIPALYASALRPDPLAGALDLALLVEQMNFYFREGEGKNAFGAQQAVAIAAVERMQAITEGTAASLGGDPEARQKRLSKIREFARSHPIDGSFWSRDTALIALARFSEGDSAGMLAGVSQATETLADISMRLNTYVLLVPRMTRWQVDLAAQEITGRENLWGTLDDIQALGDTARRANTVLADIPGAAREASGPIRELVDQERIALLAAIEQERLDITQFITAERQAALAALGEERRAAMESIGMERAEVLARLDALANRSIEDASGRARGMANYVFWRALILIVVAAVLFTGGYVFARGRRGQAGPTLE